MLVSKLRFFESGQRGWVAYSRGTRFNGSMLLTVYPAYSVFDTGLPD